MKRFLTFLILFFGMFYFNLAYGEDNYLNIVYPYSESTINANSTFFIGNTHPDAKLTINGQEASVYNNGSFVRVMTLPVGKNMVTIKSNNKGNIKTKTLLLNVLTNRPQKTNPVFIQNKQTIRITKDEVPIRLSPYGKRLSPAKRGMIFESVGETDNHYKVKTGENYSYILKDDANAYKYEKIPNQVLTKITIEENKKYIIIKIPTIQPFSIQCNSIDNKLYITADDVVFNFLEPKLKTSLISDLNFTKKSFNIALYSNNIVGYDYKYHNKELRITLRKPFSKGLKDKIIVLDPGHGGDEFGSIGPTEVAEKYINLKIATYLKELLEIQGAKVYMTRNDDRFVDLYERVKFAQKKKADILISIHNNALPDGGNPYKTHGTTTYYYHKQSAPLARSIQKSLLNWTRFNDLGIQKDSFVLVRPSMPLSVLVEVGFMINPYEYEKLIRDDFQMQCAYGLAQGIENYFSK